MVSTIFMICEVRRIRGGQFQVIKEPLDRKKTEKCLTPYVIFAAL